MITTSDKNEGNEEATKYYCHLCDYKCCRKDNFERHKMTPKHQKMTKHNNYEFFECVHCDKKYKYRQGLSKHKKQCAQVESVTTNNTSITPELIIEIIKQNQEFKTLLVEQNKSIIELSKNSSITNNTVNSHNKTFNLQIFLNDTCKNAMNLTDFVSSLQIDLEDLESVGELGFVNGLSKLIIGGLNDLEECERPVHCSDLKRESMYVKGRQQMGKRGYRKHQNEKGVKANSSQEYKDASRVENQKSRL